MTRPSNEVSEEIKGTGKAPFPAELWSEFLTATFREKADFSKLIKEVGSND
jgi:hypothetical protein